MIDPQSIACGVAAGCARATAALPGGRVSRGVPRLGPHPLSRVSRLLELGTSQACGQTLGRPIRPPFLPRVIHRGVKCWIQ
jgi:hypothetical protein